MLDYQDVFKVLRKEILSMEEVNILTELYLPIIGVDSFSLYFVLSSLKEKENFLVKKLLDNLNFHHVKDLEQTLSKLEALGLVKTYINKDSHIAFQIYKPLDYESFFKSPLLSEYLGGQIGLDERDKIKKLHEKKVSLVGYKDCSKSFDEVFMTSTESLSSIYSHLQKDFHLNSITLKEVDFDYVYFKLSLDEEDLQDVLNDPSFRKGIIELSHVYHLNEDEMREVVLTTNNIDKELTFDYLSKNARNLYRTKTNANLVKLETKEKDKFVSSGVDDETFKLINYLDQASFADILKMLSGITPSNSELKMFEELKKNTKFSNGVINVMILYVSQVLDGQIPGYNYFEKIANVWARANITTTLEAHNYVLDKLNGKTQQTKKFKTNKVKTPDWYDDYLKDVDSSKNTTNELSEEEINKIFEEAKDL